MGELNLAPFFYGLYIEDFHCLNKVLPLDMMQNSRSFFQSVMVVFSDAK